MHCSFEEKKWETVIAATPLHVLRLNVYVIYNFHAYIHGFNNNTEDVEILRNSIAIYQPVK